MVLMLALLLCGQDLTPGAQKLGAMFKARYAMVSGDLEAALDYCEQAISLDPSDAESAYLMVTLLVESNSSVTAATQERQLSALKLFYGLFPHDYRFALAMGTFLVKERLIKPDPELASPDSYLQAAVGLMGSDDALLAQRSDAHYYLGLWYFRSDKLFNASRAFEEVVTLDPTASWALYYAARSLEGSHQLRAALRFYEKYMKVAAFNPVEYGVPVSYSLLFLRLVIEPSLENREALVDWLHGQKDVLELRYQAIERFLVIGRYDESLALLLSMGDESRGIKYYRMLSMCRMSLHQYETLYQELEEGLAKLPANLRRYMVEFTMEAAISAGRYGDVVRLRKLYPETAKVNLKLDLFAAFAQVVAGDQSIWAGLAKKHQSSELMASLRRQVSELGLEAVALRNLALLAMEWKDWAAALRHLKALYAKAPRAAQGSDEMAVVYYSMGELQEAFARYEALLRDYPDRDDLRNNFGYFLAESGQNLGRARELLEPVIERHPENGTYLDSLSWVYFRIRDYAGAEELMVRALALEPSDPEKLEHLGDLYHAMGKTELARDAWSRAMDHAGARYLVILDKLDPAS